MSSVEGADDLRAYRYSSDKTLAWLSMKVRTSPLFCIHMSHNGSVSSGVLKSVVSLESLCCL